MKMFQIAHLTLAAIILFQSVLSFATVTPTVPQSDLSLQSTLEGDSVEAEGKAPCHDSSVELIVKSAKGCCASMDEPCCEFGCAVPSVALPVNAIPLSRLSHPPFVISDIAIHFDNSSAGLFRPPRTIQ